MNVTRLQQDLIKDVLSNKSSNYFIECSDSEAVIFTKYQVYVLDPKDFLLNYNKLVDAGVKESTTASKILDGSDDAKPAVKTGNMRVLPKCTAIELKCGEELIYVDQNLLKYFDKSAEFSGTNGKAPVYIYEDEILVGCVLPVMV